MIDDLEKLRIFVERQAALQNIVRVSSVRNIEHQGRIHPIYSYSIGCEEPSCPVLFVTGGIHGIERIGAQLAWSLLKTTIDRMAWDKALVDLFGKIRFVVLPLLNPVGYYQNSRCNGNGVDLMRNSTIQATEKVPFLLGGHRISNKLPWFQGASGVVELENQALLDVFHKEASLSDCVISVDFHSGFGMKDRLWFPFSHSSVPFDHLPEMHAFLHIFEETHPYHIYQFEPQSKAYLLNGDVWDQIYLEYLKSKPKGIFLPMTLEMGSWTWVRKNPLQVFSKNGVFNPIKQHRIKRTFRRHHLLFDFLLKALYSNQAWATLDPVQKAKHSGLALERWYI